MINTTFLGSQSLLNIEDLSEVIQLVSKLSHAALDVYNRPFHVTEKENGEGPVTEADILIDQLFTEAPIIQKLNWPIISEERKPQLSETQPDTFWCIDPVDGTKEFIKKNGEWSIMIGLVQHGEPILGFVAQPALNKLYFGGSLLGQSLLLDSFLNFKDENSIAEIAPQFYSKLKMKNLEWEQCTLIRSKSHRSKKIDDFMKITNLSKDFAHGSIGLKLALICAGQAEVYLNLSNYCHYWDICAGDAILRTAHGGVFVGKGLPLHYLATHDSVKEPFFACHSKLALTTGNHILNFLP